MSPRQRRPRSHRDALVLALLPRPRPDLPDPAAVDLAPFWRRFDAAAPALLRLGAWLAALVVIGLLPWACAGRPWRRLDEPGREAVLARAARLPGGEDLLEVGKLLACWAWFDQDPVQDAFRGTAP